MHQKLISWGKHEKQKDVNNCTDQYDNRRGRNIKEEAHQKYVQL
jgi:hypothetical protein